MNYIFNVYFLNVARKLNIDKYSDVDAPDFKQYLRNSVNNSLFLSPNTDNETHDIINSLDSNRSNDISPKLPTIDQFRFFLQLQKFLKSLSTLEFISFWTRIKFYTTISLVSEKRTQQSTQFKQLYILSLKLWTPLISVWV